MKNVLCVILCLAMLVLAGCAQRTDSSLSPADKQVFLDAMAKGIKNRLEKDASTDGKSDSEIAQLYRKLVDCELKEIERYKNAVFDDDKFTQLAKEYINACEMQRTATENYRNTELYNALWNGGRTVRAGIITYFYQNYDLDLTSEEAESYAAKTTVTYSVSGDSTDFLDVFHDSDDVQLGQEDLFVTDASSEASSVSWSNSKVVSYSYVVKNNSSHELNMVSVEAAILDANKNILGETSASAWITIPAGKTVKCESKFNLDDYPDAKYIQIDSLSYDGNGDHVSHTVAVSEKNKEAFLLVWDEYEPLASAKPNTAYEEESTFANAYGTRTTLCAHTGCSSFIASSGDTNCCTTHSNRCLECAKYIDEDAVWCVDCLAKAAEQIAAENKNTCVECGKNAKYKYDSFTGQTEYYCAEHYEELKELFASIGMTLD